MLYAAYGSNLNKDAMFHRCTASKAIGASVVKDYCLEFRSGLLNIEPKKGSKVPVGIWDINEEDEKKLDLYEGYPDLYRKEYFDLKVKGKIQKVLIYVMNKKYEIFPPAKSYFDLCLVGCSHFDISPRAIFDALHRVNQLY